MSDPAIESGAGPLLVRVVEREPHDLGRDALLVAVDLADLDLGADRGVLTSMRQSAMFLPSIGERLPLVTTPTWERPDVDAVAVPAVSLPSSSRPTSWRCGAALRFTSASRPTKSSSLRLERHGEADAGLEGIDLVVELVAGEDQPGLDPQHVERVEARAAADRAAARPPITASQTAARPPGGPRIS